MPNKRVKPFLMTASGVVAAQSSTVQAVTIHSMVLTETAGTTNESVIFYVPAASGDGSHPAVASASGTKVMTLEVPKGTSIVIAPLGNDEGMFFENGVYIALSGGTPSLTLGIS